MGDMQIILEKAAFAGKEVCVKTRDRGIIVGMFTGIDEFESDPERLGFYLSIKPHFYDTVFPDEIVEIFIIENVWRNTEMTEAIAV